MFASEVAKSHEPPLAFASMTSDNDNLEGLVRENLRLRRDLMGDVAKASEPVTYGQKVRRWWSARFGRGEDQPFFFALLFVLIATTLYVFL
jgi:hypothetical protein